MVLNQSPNEPLETKTLLPGPLENYINNDTVDVKALFKVVKIVESEWTKRLKGLEAKTQSSEWNNELGLRISWPMAELDENIAIILEPER